MTKSFLLFIRFSFFFFSPLQYNIKKREEVQEMTQEEPNPLMRKKKTPEELAAEAEAEEEDEITSTCTIRKIRGRSFRE